MGPKISENDTESHCNEFLRHGPGPTHLPAPIPSDLISQVPALTFGPKDAGWNAKQQVTSPHPPPSDPRPILQPCNETPPPPPPPPQQSLFLFVYMLLSSLLLFFFFFFFFSLSLSLSLFLLLLHLLLLTKETRSESLSASAASPHLLLFPQTPTFK